MLTDSEIRRRTQHRPTFQLVPSCDWRALLLTRANLLVNGPKDALEAFVHMARPEMREPIRTAAAALPPFLVGARTLILGEVEALERRDQLRLRRWFDERQNKDVQVVSLTTVPLFSLVAANAFDAELFYRLNTIFLEVQAA
jgi:hypothetical protein